MAKASQSAVPDAWAQDHPAPAVPSLVERKSKPTPKAQAVRDDWDDDDDEQDENLNETAAAEGLGGIDGDGSLPSQTQQLQSKSQPQPQRSNPDTIDIWQEANARPPMPELISAPSSTSQFSPPPPAALQPTLRILKRPSPSHSPSPSQSQSQSGSFSVGSFTTSTTSSPGSGTASPGPRGTLAEREAQYQEARSRIFGEKSTGGNSNAASGTGVGLEGAARPVVAVVRDPLGPAFEPGGQDNGRPARGFGDRRRGGGGKKPSSDGSTRN